MPTWLYREAYYQTMVYRLMVLGGAASRAANNTYVVNVRQRQDVSGREFCEVVDRWQYATPEEAKLTASQRGAGFEAVGLTPVAARVLRAGDRRAQGGERVPRSGAKRRTNRR